MLNENQIYFKFKKVLSHELVGRKRLMASVALKLIDDGLKDDDKLLSLKSAINSSVQKHHDRMYNRLLEEVKKLENNNIKHLLEKMVLASLLTDGQMTFLAAENNQRDLVDIGLCRLISEGQNFRYKLAEPLAIRVAVEVLNAEDITVDSIVLNKAKRDLLDSLIQFGSKSSQKGLPAEILTCSQLLLWNGKKLAELPIINKTINEMKLPSWMNDISLNISKYGTAEQLGYTDDIEVIRNIQSGNLKDVLLRPANHMG